VAKIKKFAKEYIVKILHKLEKSSKKHNGSSSSTAQAHATSSTSVSAETPNSHGDGPDIVMADMMAEEAMDLGEDSGDDEDGEDDAKQSPDTSPVQDVHDDLKDEAMEIWAQTSDPRRHANAPISDWDRDRGPTGSALSVGS
jgi:[histone H3]-lysine36 N-trimethyltransferase